MHGGVHFGSLEFRLPRMAFVGQTGIVFDLLLKLDHGVENGFGDRRATRNVDVHGNDLIDALHDVIGAIEPAARRAGAHRNHPLGLGHLIVDLLEDRAPSCR